MHDFDHFFRFKFKSQLEIFTGACMDIKANVVCIEAFEF